MRCDPQLCNAYISLLKEELVPALGCTEPIAIAYASAKARDVLGCMPKSLQVRCSGNVIKNVKSVIVPKSGGLRGIDIAATLGAVHGNATKELEVLQDVTERDIEITKRLVSTGFCRYALAAEEKGLFIDVCAFADNQFAEVEIRDFHTNITKIVRNNLILLQKTEKNHTPKNELRSFLSVKNCVAFAESVDIALIEEIIDRQIELNSAIANEGLSKVYGMGIGRTFLKYYDMNDVRIRAQAKAAAGSDARMDGCSMPVVINSGSGNQGMAVSLPVIEYANELHSSHDDLVRALALANLIALLQKRYIGSLSAFCGAVCAAAGAASGITFLHGGRYEEVSRTITNTLAIISGIICDGAKPSCAAKIASSIDTAILGFMLGQKEGRAFKAGDGLVKDDIEETIKSVGRIGKIGMSSTDLEILNIMLGN